MRKGLRCEFDDVVVVVVLGVFKFAVMSAPVRCKNGNKCSADDGVLDVCLSVR
jgi:hypothetical protein